MGDYLGTGDFEHPTAGGLIAVHGGVQTDLFAAFALFRGSTGLNAPFLFQIVGLVELTLADLVQLGIGGSFDGASIEAPARCTEEGQPAMPVGRNCDAIASIGFGIQTAGLGPGFEIRIGAAAGGGPYERRGFVATAFFHMSFLATETLALGGLEIGLQSY